MCSMKMVNQFRYKGVNDVELLLKDKNGNCVPVEQIGELNEGDIVIRMSIFLNREDRKELEKELSNKFGRKVIVLDGKVSEILVVPPKNDV